MRRLPVYLLVDISASMKGKPLDEVRMGMRMLVSELKSDLMAAEIVHLSVITFGDTAQQVVPLTGLSAFQEPAIEAGGGCSLGAAFEELLRCTDREVVRQTSEKKGDWKPFVFLMTGGHPSDVWQDAAGRAKQKRLNIVACAAGPSADESLLKRITEAVLRLQDCQPETMKAVFRWSTPSIKTVSVRRDVVESEIVDVPPPPPSIPIV